MFACRVYGHRFRFDADGAVLRWECQRGCGAGGAKSYPSATDARRYAAAFDEEDREKIGRNAPILGMFQLRIWYWHSHRRPGDETHR